MRGEHWHMRCPRRRVVGSSPHARGALGYRLRLVRTTRIIPACAGSTPGRPTARQPCWDHPRMRGEHSASGSARANCAGSSPHARGAPRRDAVEAVLAGIIPACAGSTVIYLQAYQMF